MSATSYGAGVYDGERNTFNRFHGQGTYTYGNGKVYSGIWRDGRRHGQGTQTWPNGDKYVGTWSESRAHGKGVKTWANGDRYDGNWIGGKSSGTGHFVWSNGDDYTGGFLKGKRSGLGIFKSKSLGVYQGEWKADKKQGKGTLTSSNGTEATGQWNNDYLVGDVVFVFSNGNQYTGPVSNNLPNGEGVCKVLGKLAPCQYNKGKRVVKKVAKKVVRKPKPIPAPIVKPKPKAVVVKKVVKPAPAKPIAKLAPKVVVPTPVVKPSVPVILKTPSPVKTTPKPVVKVVKPVVLPTVPKVDVGDEGEKAVFARRGKHRSGAKSKKPSTKAAGGANKPAFLKGPMRSDGAIFSFKHDWIANGYYDTAPTVWAKFDAIKFGDLKLRAEGGDYELTMVIDEYDGLGAYPLKYFKGVISKPGVASYQTTSTLPGRVVIKFDDGKKIGGYFEFVAYRNGNQSSSEKRTVRGGEFLVPLVK